MYCLLKYFLCGEFWTGLCVGVHVHACASVCNTAVLLGTCLEASLFLVLPHPALHVSGVVCLVPRGPLSVVLWCYLASRVMVSTKRAQQTGQHAAQCDVQLLGEAYRRMVHAASYSGGWFPLSRSSATPPCLF